jgi:hypothetical protein
VPLSIYIPGGILGYPENIQDDLFYGDVALICEVGAGWMVFSLYKLIGLVHYRVMMKGQDGSDCSPEYARVHTGKSIITNMRCYGNMSTIFRHKLADDSSLPINWFSQGPTLSLAILKECKSALCDMSLPMDWIVCPMFDVVKKLDSGITKVKNIKEGSTNNKPLDVMFYTAHGVFVASPELLKMSPLIRSGKAKVVRNVVLDKMPKYAPFLQPIDVCGPNLAEKKDSTSYWDCMKAEDIALDSRCTHFSLRGDRSSKNVS